ncbi:hypothetical protein BDZ89DRAFT_1153900 [Hymenopellis radicata]|nr:hypothetical protein BDZ89DRAFT_1153900 [Hymenopellis radicata]
MSLTAARLARRAVSYRLLAAPSARQYSSHSDEHHDEHHHEDSTVYPEETFFNAFWAKVVVGSAAVALAYKFAPPPSKDVYLTRWIDMYSPDVQKNLDYNLTNALLARQTADDRLTFYHARRPQILRMQAPQMLNNGSPFNMPVGLTVDLSEIEVKSD